jgi:hypothetical protein
MWILLCEKREGEASEQIFLCGFFGHPHKERNRKRLISKISPSG